MLGHSTPSILQTYAKVIDEYRRDAIRKLEALRRAFHDKQALAQNADVRSHLTN
jgi:hypothetical protein